MHGNARLTPVGRLTLVMRIEAGLIDRSSRPRSCPHRTTPQLEAQIAELRRTFKRGPVRIGWQLGVPASTVHRVLCRLGGVAEHTGSDEFGARP